jgi:hypothetical protein
MKLTKNQKRATLVAVIGVFIGLLAVPVPIHGEILAGTDPTPSPILYSLFRFGQLNFTFVMENFSLSMCFEGVNYTFSGDKIDAKVYTTDVTDIDNGNGTVSQEADISLKITNCKMSSASFSGQVGYIEVILKFKLYEDHVNYYVYGVYNRPVFYIIIDVITNIHFNQPPVYVPR